MRGLGESAPGLLRLPRGSSRARHGAIFSGKNHKGPPPSRQDRSRKVLAWGARITREGRKRERGGEKGKVKKARAVGHTSHEQAIIRLKSRVIVFELWKVAVCSILAVPNRPCSTWAAVLTTQPPLWYEMLTSSPGAAHLQAPRALVRILIALHRKKEEVFARVCRTHAGGL